MIFKSCYHVAELEERCGAKSTVQADSESLANVPACTSGKSRTRTQKGHLKDGPRFAIQRGVKQGDVLSPTLFNAGLEHAFRSWKAKLSTQGLHVGVPERLTNVRYADDIIVYAKTAINFYEERARRKS